MSTLDSVAPTAPNANCQDSRGVNFAGGNQYSVIGSWGLTVP